jgi:hypothetical protein
MPDPVSRREKFAAIASVSFAIVTTVTPIPDAVRVWLVPTAWGLLAAAIAGYLITRIPRRVEYAILATVFVLIWGVTWAIVRSRPDLEPQAPSVKANDIRLPTPVPPAPAAQPVPPPATQTKARPNPEKPNVQPNITQQSSGANSPNIVVGNNSQATILTERVRELSNADGTALVRALVRFAGTPVHLNIALLPEPQHFGGQMENVLRRAGWDVTAADTMFSGQVPNGLVLHSEGRGQLASIALIKELKRIGIPYEQLGPTDDTRGGKVTIGIGPLPIR